MFILKLFGWLIISAATCAGLALALLMNLAVQLLLAILWVAKGILGLIGRIFKGMFSCRRARREAKTFKRNIERLGIEEVF